MRENKSGWMPVVVAGMILSGCATFSPSPDPAHFFTLTSVYQADRNLFQSPANPGQLSFGIRPIKFRVTSTVSNRDSGIAKSISSCGKRPLG
jgi:hypothetical protein